MIHLARTKHREHAEPETEPSRSLLNVKRISVLSHSPPVDSITVQLFLNDPFNKPIDEAHYSIRATSIVSEGPPDWCFEVCRTTFGIFPG